jgi:FkbM family methyltransferase
VARHLPEARIYAFEPSKTVYEQLGRSLADGRTSAPSTSASPAPAERRRCTHTRWKGNASRCSRPSTAGCRRRCLRVELAATEPIDVQTLDAFCEEQGVGHIDLLKLDVEGHELAVLRGAERMLSAGRVSMIQFEFGPANIYSRTYFYDFWAMLAPAYDLFRIVPRGIVAIPGYGEHLEVFLTTNYLAVRRGD